MSREPTRRALIGGAGLAAVIAAVPAVAASTAMSPAGDGGISLGLAGLLSAVDARKADYDAFYQSTVKPSESRYYSSRGTEAETAARHAHDAVNKRFDEMVTLCSHAECAVASHPVHTAVDLHAKLAFMVEHEMGDGMDWLADLLADAARLSGREG